MRYLLTFLMLVFYVLGFAQTKYQVLKDTTDSSSIVHKIQEIPEIEVSSKNPLSNIKSGSGGVFIDVPALKMLPSILGDSDPFKALQYMGGMSQAGDASANIHVRGGENDQNLILLNGSPVENPTHILGLFSVFNPDLIDQMQYLKAGIPAEYGGRLSSVIDVKNFINPPSRTELTGNIGLIASRLSLKSHIGNQFSYYAAARASYIQYAIIPLLLKLGVDPHLAQNSFEYYDSGAVYVRDEWEAGPLLLNVGIRTSLYHKLLTHHSSEDFGLSEIDAAKTFIRLEPRLSGRIQQRF